MKLLQSLKTK